MKRRPGDHMSMIEYRLTWARNGLKLIDAIENWARGVWSITEKGRPQFVRRAADRDGEGEEARGTRLDGSDGWGATRALRSGVDQRHVVKFVGLSP